MFKNLKEINALGWIQAEYAHDSAGSACLEPGDPLYDRAQAGEFGSIAPFVAPDPAEIAAQDARAERDRLLAASDWTQVADAPVDAAAWATYRQALRDVPQQAGFPDNITWPEAPA
jgi:hypothetical protein